MNTLWLILAVLTTFRLTRLITADQISLPIRTWVLDRNPYAGYLVTCDWCLSIWIAPCVAILTLFHGERAVVQIGLVAFAASAITGLLSMVESRLEQ